MRRPPGFRGAARHGLPPLAGYANVPCAVAVVVDSRLATLRELQTVYGLRDLYDMVEILAVRRENERRIEEWRSRKS